MSAPNNTDSWNAFYVARSYSGNYEFEYKLKTAARKNVNAASPFDYVMQSLYLEILRKPNEQYFNRKLLQ
jgi:hypothetical protein